MQGILLAVFMGLIPCSVALCKETPPAAPELWKRFPQLRTLEEVTVTQAALSLVELVKAWPDHRESLDAYFAGTPLLLQQTGEAGRSYALVVFRDEGSRNDRAAFVLFQRCSGLLRSLESGFVVNAEHSLIAGFRAGPQSGSGPDYFMTDACRAGDTQAD